MYFFHHARKVSRLLPNRQAGLSLLETVVWIGVFTMAMTAITSTLLSLYRSNAYTVEQGQAVDSARKGIASAVREMREAQYGGDGSYPIVSIGPNSFEFYADVDNDAAIERVRYEVVGTNFVRSVLQSSGDPIVYTGTETQSTVSDQVRNLANNVTTFTYYDTNGAQITDYTKTRDVRFVRLDLVVNINPNRLPNELTLRSSAALRNLIGR
jgi:hypothetical protein